MITRIAVLLLGAVMPAGRLVPLAVLLPRAAGWTPAPRLAGRRRER